MLLKDFLPLLKGQKVTIKKEEKFLQFSHSDIFSQLLHCCFTQTTCSVGRSMKMCLSSLPGLIRALSKMSALLVEARTMTWSVVPIPAEEREEGSKRGLISGAPPATSAGGRLKLTVHLHQQLV